MNSEFKQFIIKILLVVFILASAGWIIFTFVAKGKYLPVLPWMLAFFALVTVVTYGYQLWLINKDTARFARSSMMVSFLRLLVYSLFALLYLAGNYENAVVFVVCMVIVYLVFSLVEVSGLSRISKQNRK